MVESTSEDEIAFVNRTAISAFPCSSRGARGWPISTLLMDEAAFFLTETEGPQVADRVFNALVPATAQFGDAARIIVSSTPWGQDGLFAQLYQQARSGELTDAAAHHATTAEVNPTIDAEFLAREQARDPDNFKSEYEAEFVGSGAAYLDPDRIDGAVADGRGELRPEDAVSWIAGIDPAFSSDPFGLAIVGRDPADRRRLLLGCARAWTPARRKPASLEESRQIEDSLLGEVARTCQRFNARVVTDQYKSAGVTDRLRRFGLSVRTEPMTAPSKDAAFGFLKGRLYDGSLELYEQPDLLAELRRLRVRYTAGRSSIVNPRVGRSHGDLAQGLALAVFEHDRHGLGGSKIPPLPEPDEKTRTISAGILDREEGFGPERDSTRRPKWYDDERSIADRVF
jgi:phage FluMu gp28-like protein